MARHRIVHVILPSGWREIPRRTPREYRRDGKGSGVLQLSLQPSLLRLIEAPDTVLASLQKIIREIMPELDEAVYEQPIDCSAGPGAFSLRRSKQHGLVGLWVISADVPIFATYFMGLPETLKVELEDAMTIMQSVYIEDAPDLS
jgi:hypothetical protein